MNFAQLRSAVALAASIALMPLAHAQEATGAGSSFLAPVVAKWADAYSKATGAHINYQSIGSGAGIKQINAKTVDFGASDMPLKDEELKSSGLLQFPTVIGGVVPVVNIAGIKPGQLKITGAVLADIYLGKIAKWNDPELTKLNPGVALPDAPISVVRRADGSGTTFLFTNYLSKVSGEWKSSVGDGTAVNWPEKSHSSGGKGNEGVSQYVQRLGNSIGYVEYAYAKQNKMTYVLMQNHDGAYVQPEESAFKAAAAGAEWNKTFYQVLTDEPGKNSWPITGTTYVLMHVQQDKPVNGSAVLKFFDWSFSKGDQMAQELDYVPLPDSVKNAIRKQWGDLKDASGKSISYK